MVLPVSIVVPKILPSDRTLITYCLPSVRENDPAEIIVENGEGDACAKRKAGAAKATQPYLLFVDENIFLYEWALKKMKTTLDEFKDISFVYSDTRIFTGKQSSVKKAAAWDAASIKGNDYVRIASLMRREAFPANADLKDPTGRDIWTSMADAGCRGLYIGEVLFEIHEERN